MGVAKWTEIRNDRLKGMSYTELGRKYHIDPLTAKRYAESPQRPEYTLSVPKPTKLDAYKQQVDQWLEEAPYSAVRILEKRKEQVFEGKYSIVKEYVRSRKMDLDEKATVRFETMPGKQGQMDWGLFEDHTVYEDGKWKKLYCFLLVLGYSRMRYIEFVTDMSTNTLIRCHQNAFRYFGGYPEEILYDNMKQEGSTLNLTMDRLRENLEILKMKNTLEILDNYLERAVADKLNIVEVLGHIFSEEAKSKRKRAYEKQVQMSGFPIKKTLDDFYFSFQPSIDKHQTDELATMRFLENRENIVFLGPTGVGKTHLASALGLVAAQHRFSTYYINCHQLIEQLKKAHFENRLPDKLKVLAKYRILIIDEIGYLPMDIQGANLFFQLIARRYEKNSTVFTSNKTFSQWNEVFADVTIASAILGRVLHHCTVINIKGESYRLKERKEFMRQKQQIVNTLFDQGNA